MFEDRSVGEGGSVRKPVLPIPLAATISWALDQARALAFFWNIDKSTLPRLGFMHRIVASGMCIFVLAATLSLEAMAGGHPFGDDEHEYSPVMSASEIMAATGKRRGMESRRAIR